MAASLISNNTVRRNKPILSIRARLVILALLAVVPLMLDRVRLLEASRMERIDAVAAEALDLARRGAEGQRDMMTTMRALLQAVARAYALSDKTENCAAYLDRFRAGIPWLRSLSVVGANGRITCSTWPSAVGFDVADRPYVRDAIRTGDFAVSDYLIGRTRRQPTILAAYPVPAKNDRQVIIASIDLQWMVRLTSSVTRHAGATVMLIDDKGTVIARHPEPDKWIGSRFADHPLVRTMLSGDEGKLRMPELNGDRRIFGFVRIPWSDARLAVGLEEGAVLSRIDREISLAYLQLGFIGLIVFLIAWFGGERLIVDPIRSLARTASRIGRGELDLRPARDDWAIEFQPLAAALDETARKLAERDRELRAANRHLEELASIDCLSALANRRGFDARLQTEWQRALRLKRPLGLLMVDVDHFKLFNDTYGHLEGDNCLRSLGELMAGVASGDDLPARYGGEEFALLLPGADIEKAIEVAERLRQSVEALRIINVNSPDHAITVSVGVASLVPREDEGAERLVEAADAGLYAAKRRGRNMVVAHAPVELAEAG